MPVAEKTTLGASTLHVFGAFFVLIINLDAVLIKIGHASIRAGEKFQLPIVLKSGHQSMLSPVTTDLMVSQSNDIAVQSRHMSDLDVNSR